MVNNSTVKGVSPSTSVMSIKFIPPMSHSEIYNKSCRYNVGNWRLRMQDLVYYSWWKLVVVKLALTLHWGIFTYFVQFIIFLCLYNTELIPWTAAHPASLFIESSCSFPGVNGRSVKLTAFFDLARRFTRLFYMNSVHVEIRVEWNLSVTVQQGPEFFFPLKAVSVFYRYLRNGSSGF